MYLYFKDRVKGKVSDHFAIASVFFFLYLINALIVATLEITADNQAIFYDRCVGQTGLTGIGYILLLLYHL